MSKVNNCVMEVNGKVNTNCFAKIMLVVKRINCNIKHKPLSRSGKTGKLAELGLY